MKLKSLIRPFPILFVILVLLLMSGFFYYSYQMDLINQNFNPNAQFEDWNFNHISETMEAIKENDFDLSVPGVDGQITFTMPYDVDYFYQFVKNTIEKGTTITTDFVTYSKGNSLNTSRAVLFFIDEKQYEVRISVKDMARLYMVAIKENNRSIQFEEDYGKKLTYRSARNALRTLDKQLYDNGVTKPDDYPFDSQFWRNLLQFSAWLAPLSLIILAVFVSFMMQNLRYRSFLKEYNIDQTKSWDEIAGTLPQFQSLKNSGIVAPPKEIPHKATLLDAIKNLFRPIS